MTGAQLTVGPPLESAASVALVLHGRGQSPEYMRPAAERFAAAGVHCLLPHAEDDSWYPLSFLQPVANNEPKFSTSLATLSELLDGLEAAGKPPERTVLAGFSQGACMTAELAARRGRRYQAAIIWTGGLLGPAGTEWATPAGTRGMNILLTGSDVDEFVPEARVNETASVFRRAGATVEVMITPGRPHEIPDGEIARAVALLRG
jgi:predicted esterase